ncbi:MULTISPECIES: GNAT family N-acetyltransferase [unclassified Paenibacillus]|uniref:GNAT family N-acetyltransferase n=1 Tax=unclassified Paenibacillus TaxID=185978 RepID=UPI00095518EB|nr:MULTISPECIES: GNAT family N-acetyltransferase [unclassified Paenibacillus]ASS67483.1 GNAT family N-acetyltransferase [Paenibacillus sp. RUD330]SIQ75459.1 Acetyltransferase (GNAT) domain-containing protein [Paenibacillus sp. RU4X]SIQ96886.1 Acetyltransferase (GNAT) domain-containing protein [Paenibacillus sp. RU4T]
MLIPAAQPCSKEEIGTLIDEYVNSVAAPFDSFLEEHILESAFYSFQSGTGVAGYYAVHGEALLTQFYIRTPWLKDSQALFGQVMERHTIQSLLLPTCDELFLSLALDTGFPIRKQAYLFQEGIPRHAVPAPDRSGDSFRPAELGDAETIGRVCGEFLDQYEQRLASGELFVLFRGDLLLGIGVLEKSRLFEGTASIGMFVDESCRNQGVGRSLILRLRQRCAEQGLTAVSGCGYGNEASKRTLESAGMVTRTRLLRIAADGHSVR